MVTVRLVSDNEQLHRDCRQILPELLGDGWRLVWGLDGERETADLVVWDCASATASDFSGAARVARNVFLVTDEHLPRLCRRLLIPNVLLQPADRATLKEFLAAAVHSPDKNECGGDSRRPERDALLQCLLLAEFKLERTDLEQCNFLSRALYDFRVPLTVLQGYCDLLLEECLGSLNADQRDTLRQMQGSIRRLSALSTAVFNLSVGGLGEPELRIQKGDIVAVLGQAVYELTAGAEARQIDIVLRAGDPPASMFFDAGHVEQVLLWLLRNACNFTSPGGSIVVRGYPVRWHGDSAGTPAEEGSARGEEPNAYRIDISDNGPALPPEQNQAVFRPFSSYSGSQDRSGPGLGLATSRMIAAAHGGAIFAQSDEEYTTFSMVLPFFWPKNAKLHPPEPSIQPVAAPLVGEAWNERDRERNAR